MLSRANYATKPPRDLPTWVPDWRQSIPHEHFQLSIRPDMPAIYFASGSSKPEVRLSPDSKELTLHGYVVDVIRSKSSETSSVGQWRWVLEKLGDRTLPTIYDYTNETMETALIRTVTLDQTARRERFDPESPQTLQNHIQRIIELRFRLQASENRKHYYPVLDLAKILTNRLGPYMKKSVFRC